MTKVASHFVGVIGGIIGGIIGYTIGTAIINLFVFVASEDKLIEDFPSECISSE